MFGPPEPLGQDDAQHALDARPGLRAGLYAAGTTVDLAVPCSFDFNVAATKYFAAMEEGEIPLASSSAGRCSTRPSDGSLQVAPISLDKQADFRLPVAVWKQMMDHYYPHSAWLCLDRDVFDRLLRYKAGSGLPTWEQAIEILLARETQQVTS